MATVGDLLRQVPFMQRPMAGARADGGRDELGNPTMRDFLGRGYMADYSGYEVDRLQDYLPEMNPERASTAPRATTRAAPAGMSQPGLSGVAAALMGGVTAPARAARGEDMRMGDVMSTALDFGLGGAAGVAPAGALRNMAMRSTSQADEIAQMLRDRRADEITDEMMAAADPQELYRLYESGATGMDMPMDEASRMARADQFWPSGGYHGGAAGIPDLRPSEYGVLGSGVYAAKGPSLANKYADDGAVYPLRFRSDSPASAADHSNAAAEVVARDGFKGYGPQSKAQTELLQSRGFSGVDDGEAVNIFNPASIRSRFARFDPRLKHLRNLSASGAGAAALLGGTENEGSR